MAKKKRKPQEEDMTTINNLIIERLSELDLAPDKQLRMLWTLDRGKLPQEFITNKIKEVLNKKTDQISQVKFYLKKIFQYKLLQLQTTTELGLYKILSEDIIANNLSKPIKEQLTSEQLTLVENLSEQDRALIADAILSTIKDGKIHNLSKPNFNICAFLFEATNQLHPLLIHEKQLDTLLKETNLTRLEYMSLLKGKSYDQTYWDLTSYRIAGLASSGWIKIGLPKSVPNFIGNLVRSVTSFALNALSMNLSRYDRDTSAFKLYDKLVDMHKDNPWLKQKFKSIEPIIDDVKKKSSEEDLKRLIYNSLSFNYSNFMCQSSLKMTIDEDRDEVLLIGEALLGALIYFTLKDRRLKEQEDLLKTIDKNTEDYRKLKESMKLLKDEQRTSLDTINSSVDHYNRINYQENIKEKIKKNSKTQSKSNNKDVKSLTELKKRNNPVKLNLTDDSGVSYLFVESSSDFEIDKIKHDQRIVKIHKVEAQNNDTIYVLEPSEDIIKQKRPNESDQKLLSYYLKNINNLRLCTHKKNDTGIRKADNIFYYKQFQKESQGSRLHFSVFKFTGGDDKECTLLIPHSVLSHKEHMNAFTNKRNYDIENAKILMEDGKAVLEGKSVLWGNRDIGKDETIKLELLRTSSNKGATASNALRLQSQQEQPIHKAKRFKKV